MNAMVRAIPTLSALIVGIASFTLSFVALSEVAAEVNAVPAHLAWLVPIVVDGGILAASASLWAAIYKEQRRDPIAYLTVASLLAFSVVVNINHAGESLLAKSIAALPPIVLLACLELVAASHRRHTPKTTPAQTQTDNQQHGHQHDQAHGQPHTSENSPAAVAPPQHPARPETTSDSETNARPSTPTRTTRDVKPAPQPVTVNNHTTHSNTPSSEPQPAPGTSHSSKESKADQVRAAFDTWLLEGNNPSDPALVSTLATEIGVSETYVRRLIRPMRETRIRAQSPR